MNLLFHTGRVAGDKRFNADVSGRAAVKYFWSALELAWRESRRAEGENELFHNVAVALYEFIADGAKTLLEEQQVLVPGANRERNDLTMPAQQCCMQFIFGKMYREGTISACATQHRVDVHRIVDRDEPGVESSGR